MAARLPLRIALAAGLAMTPLLAPGAFADERPASALFGAASDAAPGSPGPVGEYARGCLVGAAQLPETGPGWLTMRPGRNRAWGHPEAVAFVARLGARAQSLDWPRLLVGDISQPRGGPMTSGHASHQIGLDIDIWLTRPGAAPLDLDARERMGAASVVRADRRGVNERWSDRHVALLQAAARDPAVARIFVNAAIKAELCRAVEGDREWLGVVRPWWGHDSHFHVRLRCPSDAGGCVDQAPPPPGDGCDETLAWWLSDEALNPSPGPKTPRRALRLADLPPLCAAVAAAP